MTLNEAFNELINSMEFKNIAKAKDAQGSKYRVYLKRFREGKLQTGALVDFLIANGYEIKANKATKKKSSS